MSKRRKQLSGADESHEAQFNVATERLRTRIQTAREAMEEGECLIAGTTIDEGYIEYGTARAHATTQEQKRTARELLQDLKRADEPFERKCVRQRPADMPDEPTMGDRVQFDRARRQYGLQAVELDETGEGSGIDFTWSRGGRYYVHYGDANHLPMSTVSFDSKAEAMQAIRESRAEGFPARLGTPSSVERLGCAACSQQLGCGDGPCKCGGCQQATDAALGCSCGGDGLGCGCY